MNVKISSLMKSVKIAYRLSRSRPLSRCRRGGSEAGTKGRSRAERSSLVGNSAVISSRGLLCVTAVDFFLAMADW
jgi:hypothetical protein